MTKHSTPELCQDTGLCQLQPFRTALCLFHRKLEISNGFEKTDCQLLCATGRMFPAFQWLHDDRDPNPAGPNEAWRGTTDFRYKRTERQGQRLREPEYVHERQVDCRQPDS